MSEADTPKSSAFSGNHHDAIDKLIEFDDQTPESDELDELLASLETPPSTENKENHSRFDALLGLEEEIEAGEPSSVPEPLQEQNNQLLRRNAELKKALETAQNELEQKRFRLRQAEDLNAQQNDEINAVSEQNLSLSQELKSYRQQEQQQTEKITHLAHQLQVSQQRVAQLERECALIQKQFQEQSYELSQAEKYYRELSFRLQQQRRHTWQFKSALNKCLESNAQRANYQLIPTPSVSSQPIPPWSSQQNQVALTEEPCAAEEDPQSPPEITEGFDQDPVMDCDQEELEWLTSTEPLDAEVDTPPSSSEDSPAPLLTCNRKKRQSYAAVELPKFVR